MGDKFSGAGEGNRTLILSLEGFSSTIELRPPILLLVVEGEGFEPSKAEPPDLQSGPVDRLGNPSRTRGRIILIVPVVVNRKKGGQYKN